MQTRLLVAVVLTTLGVGALGSGEDLPAGKEAGAVEVVKQDAAAATPTASCVDCDCCDSCLCSQKEQKQATAATVQREVVGYRQVCENGVCRLEPILATVEAGGRQATANPANAAHQPQMGMHHSSRSVVKYRRFRPIRNFFARRRR